MNPEDAIALQAIKARMAGSPMPQASQMASQAPVQAPQAMTPPQNPLPTPDHQLGDMTHKRQPTESDNLAKAVVAGTAHSDPHIQVISKLLLEKLIPLLGQGGVAPKQP